MAQKGTETLLTDGFSYKKTEPKVTKWEATKLAVYNPSKNTVLGRTPTNWGELLIFYTIFYAILAAMFAICMYGLLQSTSPDHPSYELHSSLIGVNPGLGYRPYPLKFEDDGSVIWYQAKNPENVANWTKSLDAFLSDYTNQSIEGYKNRVACDFNKPPPTGKVCDVHVDSFGPCSSKDNYSYDKSAPCIFIKLNRIYNWQPQHYTIDDIPQSAPQELKDAMSAANATQQTLIWISCAGVDAVDKENIGPLAYFPQQGFPTYYYPYLNVKGYLSPLVAVQFKRPQPGVLINIECRAWAKNIEYERSREHAVGSVHIELMVDE